MKTFSARGPGRVELLGNHTDYNDGVVLSAAINFAVTVQGQASTDEAATISSTFSPEIVREPLSRLDPQRGETAWANYPLGVAYCLREAGYPIEGFEMEVASDLPSGAGLSSSAALEVATARFLMKLFSLEISPMEVAKLCRRAENDYVGVNCGLLDQVSSIFGKRGQAIYLDCRSEQVENIPLPSDTELLVFHTGVEHRLVGGEYNERREQCFAAARALGVSALRDVTVSQLQHARSILDPLVYRRAAHVVGENERVFAGIDYLRHGDRAAFGRLMFASHESSRLNFENSTPELDLLVELAQAQPGVLGSRLTGGGFGGATISLVETEPRRGNCPPFGGTIHARARATWDAPISARARKVPRNSLPIICFQIPQRVCSAGKLSEAISRSMDQILSRLTSRLLHSYQHVGGINNIEVVNVPSKRAVGTICETLLQLIFPGFYDERPILSSELHEITSSRVR